LEELREALGAEVFHALEAVGSCMETAQRLCKEYGDPPGLFLALQPPGILRDMHVLYEPHAKELCERCKAGEDLRPGTKAEVLAGLMHTSLKTPLTSSGMALTERLFRECTEHDVGIDVGREAYPGELDELLAEARRKLRVESRGL
jgi:hypothetical protein